MRPLPVEPIAGAPEAVLGVALIRGAATPVIDAARLLTGRAGEPGRFVTLLLGERAVALAVAEVIGLRELDTAGNLALPPLLRDAADGALAALRAVDSELVVALAAGRLLPDALWRALETAIAGGGGA